jgi:hypothetical protein
LDGASRDLAHPPGRVRSQLELHARAARAAAPESALSP